MSKINFTGLISCDKSKLTHNLLNLVQGRIVVIQEELKAIEKDIVNLQSKYHMNNDEFLIQWNQGNLGDDEEFFIWEGSLKMIPELSEELSMLRDL